MLHKSLSCETQLLISLSFKLSPLGDTSITRQSIAANTAISFNIELHNKPSWDPLHAQTVHWTVEANRQPNVTGISNSNCMYPTVKQSTTASCSVQSLHSDVVELRLWLVPTITHTHFDTQASDCCWKGVWHGGHVFGIISDKRFHLLRYM